MGAYLCKHDDVNMNLHTKQNDLDNQPWGQNTSSNLPHTIRLLQPFQGITSM